MINYICCKDCTKRYLGCHGQCESYLHIKKLNTDANKLKCEHDSVDRYKRDTVNNAIIKKRLRSGV